MPDFKERRNSMGNAKYSLGGEPNDGYVNAPAPAMDTKVTAVGKHPNEGGMDSPTSVQPWQKRQMKRHVKG